MEIHGDWYQNDVWTCTFCQNIRWCKNGKLTVGYLWVLLSFVELYFLSWVARRRSPDFISCPLFKISYSRCSIECWWGMLNQSIKQASKQASKQSSKQCQLTFKFNEPSCRIWAYSHLCPIHFHDRKARSIAIIIGLFLLLAKWAAYIPLTPGMP